MIVPAVRRMGQGDHPVQTEIIGSTGRYPTSVTAPARAQSLLLHHPLHAGGGIAHQLADLLRFGRLRQ
jgi:hypothetical protein